MTHDSHDELTAIDEPHLFMGAFLAHVRDAHGHDVDSKTPWSSVVDMHAKDHEDE